MTADSNGFRRYAHYAGWLGGVADVVGCARSLLSGLATQVKVLGNWFNFHASPGVN
jgi:hypothetical protein